MGSKPLVGALVGVGAGTLVKPNRPCEAIPLSPTTLVKPDNPRQARQPMSGPTIPVRPDNPRQAQQAMRSHPVKPDNPGQARQSPSSPTFPVKPDNPRQARQSPSSPTCHAKPSRYTRQFLSIQTYMSSPTIHKKEAYARRVARSEQ